MQTFRQTFCSLIAPAQQMRFGTTNIHSPRAGRLTPRRIHVRSVAQRVGRAEASADVFGTHYSELEVDLKPNLSGEENELAQADIRKALAQFAGVNFSLKTFLTERIEETLSGYRAAVVVNIYGNDLDSLDRGAQEVARILSRLPGASGVQLQSPPGTPQVAIQLRPADVTRWGFDPVSVHRCNSNGVSRRNSRAGLRRE